MDYISVQEIAGQWKVSVRWVQKLCEQGRIQGVQRFGHAWMIPKNSDRPKDLRKERPGKKQLGKLREEK